MKRMVSGTRKGFTLVELLVSITLTIFILSLFATLFGAGNDAVRTARGSGEIERSVHASITKIRRDLQHVYIGDGVSLGEAFSSPRTIPSAGYFTIEENLPASLPWYCQSADQASAIPNNTPAHDVGFKARVQAINTRVQTPAPAGYTGPTQPAVGYRQGIDDRGVPVEIDVDDVLAFTVRLSGDNASQIFYGRVPVGSVLDNDLDPGSRFDSPDNGQFTSPMAEVCYFLRPDRPYTLAEINRPALGTDDGRLARAATFTLYRRELLVLSESQRNKIEEKIGSSALGDIVQVLSSASGPVRNPTLVSGSANFNPSLYQQYDVAVRFDPLLGQVRFNDIYALRLRQNRYGMQWLDTGPLFPDGAIGRVLNPQLCGPFYDYQGLNVNPVVDVLMHVPNPPAGTYAAGVRPIFRGRPTLFESTLVGHQGALDANYNPRVAANHASWNINNPALAFDDPLNASLGVRPAARRGQADVLLTNVLSFDVKVLNDDVPQGLRSELIASNANVAPILPPVQVTSVDLDATNVPMLPTDSRQWPACRTSALVPLSPTDQQVRFTDVALTQTVFRPGLPVANASRRASSVAPFAAGSLLPLAPMIQTDFVDLGQSLAREVPAGFGLPQGGRTWDQEARTIFGQTTGALLFVGITPAPQVPWGRQTPARWISLGRPQAWFNTQLPVSTQTIGGVYDTWAKEYNADTFANEFLLPATPRPTKYLPPYDRPLRGIQITIRTLEPRSGQVREFQVVHRF